LASLRSLLYLGPSAMGLVGFASARFAKRCGALLFVFAGVACSGTDPYSPGTKLGTFHVAAKLTQTTCGSVPDPWEFDVRLNHDGSTLYWIQGGAPIQGRVDSAARAEMKSQMTQELRAADARAKVAACAVTRTDALVVGLVDAEAKATVDPALMKSFGGSLSYGFRPTEGSDCSDQLLTTTGDFETLPCEVHYDLTGTFKSAPQ
jgi:hypothetical protein